MFLYRDRLEAGNDLAQLITATKIDAPLILALARGGVLVASAISHEIGISFDVLVTRKISYPGKRNRIIGAMSEDERAFITEDFNYADPRILEAINEERHELRRKVALYRSGAELTAVKGRNIILVDDCLSDGISALAASRFLKGKGAKRVILAVPVAPLSEDPVLMRFIDLLLCPHRVPLVASAGQWYLDFHAVSDFEVRALLGRDHNREGPTFHI